MKNITENEKTRIKAGENLLRKLLEYPMQKRKEEIELGYLKGRHGVLMIGRVPDGTCLECAVKHDPDQPHNRDSLTYQYKFYDQHGRWPTWVDAMAHCSDEIKAFWIQALREKGIEV